MRKLLIALLILSCGLSFVSANGQSETEKEDVTLSYMTWDYADKTASLDALMTDVDSQFGITIDLMNIPTDQYETTFKTKMVADDLTDFVQIHDMTGDYVTYGSKLGADKFVDISDLDAVNEYIPSVVESVRKEGGELFYVPISTNVLGAVYNKDVFKANNLTVPTNKEELEDVLKAIKSAGIVPIAQGAKESWSVQIIPFIAFGQYINSMDMDIRKKLADGSMIYADIKDDMTKVLDIQQDWAAKGYYQNDFLGTDMSVASAMVGKGEAAMLINGTWMYQAVQDANPDANIGFFALPLNAPGEETVSPSSAAGGLCINAKSENIEEAKEVLNYYLKSDYQTKVMTDLSGISTNLNVTLDHSFINDVVAALGETSVQPDWWGMNGNYHPPSSTFDLPTQFQALLADQITVDEFLGEYDR